MRFAILAAILMMSGCSPTVSMLVTLQPSPANVVERRRSPNTFVFEAQPDKDPACVQPGDLRRDCLVGFRARFETGVHEVLAAMLTEGAAGTATYTARVDTIDLHLGSEHGYTLYVVGWALSFVDKSGNAVVRVAGAERSGHISWTRPEDIPPIIQSLQSAALERIRTAVAESAAVQ